MPPLDSPGVGGRGGSEGGPSQVSSKNITVQSLKSKILNQYLLFISEILVPLPIICLNSTIERSVLSKIIFLQVGASIPVDINLDVTATTGNFSLVF